MSLVAAYRRQLSDEAAGRSHRFAAILRYFRAFWYLAIALAAAFFAWGLWLAVTAALSDGSSMALIVFPVGALALVVVGAVPYKLAQLFLSVTPTAGNGKNG